MNEPRVPKLGPNDPALDGESSPAEPEFYCARCGEPVLDPLMCGDCASLICRKCGMPLERIDELGIG